MRVAWVELPVHDGKHGRLVALEARKDIPFAVERVYYIHQLEGGAVRGQHAHRRGEELLICLRGSCEVTLDDGRTTRRFVLDRPDRGLHVAPLLWEEFRLSPDALLLAMASTAYEHADYIEDRDAFLALMPGRA